MKISLIHFSRSFFKHLAVLPLISLLYSAGVIYELPYSPFEGNTNTQVIKTQETTQSVCGSRINSVSSFLNFLEFHSKDPSLHTIPTVQALFQPQQAIRFYPKPSCENFHLRI